ncbi:unnamed protein product [marine sediment metagenome]|uniref:Kinetochore protein NDC80 loop region domain-containing protein n=1 Tax=marine sediment metagenome TaxID=412755 RepID=X0ZL41_9ZZZZ
MSLGKNTKCDLSAGIAKLDLKVLRNQIEIHYFSLMEKMEKEVSNVRNNSLSVEDRVESLSRMSSHGSDTVIRLAKQIAETTELLHTLYNTTDREIEIIR